VSGYRYGVNSKGQRIRIWDPPQPDRMPAKEFREWKRKLRRAHERAGLKMPFRVPDDEVILDVVNATYLRTAFQRALEPSRLAAVREFFRGQS
jgi:hypothetical protein